MMGKDSDEEAHSGRRRAALPSFSLPTLTLITRNPNPNLNHRTLTQAQGTRNATSYHGSHGANVFVQD